MSAIPDGLKYTEEHEYVRDTDTENEFFVGVTDYAQGELGDVVFVELPEVGKQVAKDGEAAVVESVKAASEVYAPVSGEVVRVQGLAGFAAPPRSQERFRGTSYTERD